METRIKLDIHTVTQLNNRVKSHIEDRFSKIWVEGELSSFKQYPSGHSYFNLKDNTSELSCVLFQSESANLSFKPEIGMQVLLEGNLSIYVPRGQYQFIAREMYPAGQGELWLNFEKLRQKLQDEGLFSDDRKKQLPKYPRRIGVVTSSSGAVIRDIIRVISRRAPHVSILIKPARVQGAGAEQDIATGINELNLYGNVDTIIIGRGGGSMEDLWCFNQEIVARAIVDSEIPIISAVGHETDFTISDFTADVRASTPSVAAELAVPDSRELVQYLDKAELTLHQSIQNQILYRHENLNNLLHRYGFQKPDILINEFLQKISKMQNEIKIFTIQIIENWKSRIDGIFSRLKDMNPDNVLNRGYAMVTNEENKIISSGLQIQTGENIHISLKEDIIHADVTGVSRK